ncbi:protein SMG7-like isoform X2 [Cucurbita pepo subsp. pepo]|uniref:protein SMG7-like isoform X1 n=1 Tax=Cucurbita pepo subsp. pepo TaxID=3664 RepID=UPI000C9D2E8E|nr:protein SMG7-like isoform X1 [Cucurbita pepo subsp. pepo]XP_023516119.1 protein SMG7-like isoform X2 [Cucurbita pepo subsp. pepo]
MAKMSASASSSWERAQRLYEKNIELENRRRRSAQARIPSDPNAWQQIRENYEAIILEDYAFSEQHNIEYALWQLHYKRIEELRAHFSAALTSAGSNNSQAVPTRPDRVSKIRLQFKTFLSEATGFYHDLILKIRAKYGLPLGSFLEDADNRMATDKDGKKFADMKKGLISCHRCLIYLGDLARYKGLYGEGDSKNREYTAASSYYLQAASLWPSSGNPHHQLAILASYSGDELVAVYRYFRSLAVDSPFSTARDNLIVAFEKNRQSHSQLLGTAKTSVVKESPIRFSGKGRKGEVKLATKDSSTEPPKESALSPQDPFKSFCIRLVRLNGILFTRTSLETFTEVLSLVNSSFSELLSSGPEEVLLFGTDAAENSLIIVRIVAILIFTVHNVNKETEGQTYSEIVQRAVLIQNAHIAVFELMGSILDRCSQLRDPLSSFFLPGLLVLVEWLACCPEIAAGSEVDDKQATARSKFWNHCISFFNKLLSSGSVCLDDDEDETCFFNLSKYEEGETENRLALWEDIELRGFLPLLPAQTILDFSRKHSGSDSNKEKVARIRRILAAGKALANVVKIDQEPIFYNSKVKRFCTGVEPQEPNDFVIPSSSSMVPGPGNAMQETLVEKTNNLAAGKASSQLVLEGEEEDEVIVFKPLVAEKRIEMADSLQSGYEGLQLGKSSSGGDLRSYGGVKISSDDVYQSNGFESSYQAPVTAANINTLHWQTIQANASQWPQEQKTGLVDSLQSLRLFENGHGMKSDLQNGISMFNPAAHSMPINQAFSVNNDVFYGDKKPIGALVQSRNDVPASFGGLIDPMTTSVFSSLQLGLRKNPVGRPVRHLGPPPGFNHVPTKHANESLPGSEFRSENQIMDDYSWLDGHQLPSSTKGSANAVHLTSHMNAQQIGGSNVLSGTINFPFPGKQVPNVQSPIGKQNGWPDFQVLEQLKQHNEQHLQPHQQLVNGGSQLFTSLPEQYPGQSIWTGRYFM